MSWLDVDPKQERPSTLAGVWSIKIKPINEIPPTVQSYLTELDRITANGGVAYARFHIDGNPDFNWFAARNRWSEIDFFPRFLTHATVTASLPDLTKYANFDKSITFEWGSSLTLDGELARTLILGGAYERFNGTPKAAKELGTRVCEALLGDRFLEVEVFRCEHAWSPWFGGVAWDSTLVLIDRRLQDVTVLASTDSD